MPLFCIHKGPMFRTPSALRLHFAVTHGPKQHRTIHNRSNHAENKRQEQGLLAVIAQLLLNFDVCFLIIFLYFLYFLMYFFFCFRRQCCHRYGSPKTPSEVALGALWRSGHGPALAGLGALPSPAPRVQQPCGEVRMTFSF